MRARRAWMALRWLRGVPLLLWRIALLGLWRVSLLLGRITPSVLLILFVSRLLALRSSVPSR